MPIKPRALRPGDTLGVVSPASPIESERLENGLVGLREQGYRIKFFPYVLASKSYLAGTDEQRAQDLMSAFLDPEVNAVVCSRGGYGCARLFPFLDLDAIVASRKMLIGYSDITTLHIALQRKDYVTIHAPMPLTLAYDREPWVRESLYRVLRGDADFPEETPDAECVVPGKAEGLTVGGCLCLICDSLGTFYDIDTRGKIFLIEDVDENPHRVDAMFTHLLNAGKLQEAAAVVVGEMTNTDERQDATIGARPWREIVSERLLKAGTPSMIRFPFGHMKTMLTVPLGVRAEADTTTGKLRILESPCEN